MHAHKNLKMISHQAKTQYLGEVQPAEVPDQIQQLVDSYTVKRQAI